MKIVCAEAEGKMLYDCFDLNRDSRKYYIVYPSVCNIKLSAGKEVGKI